MEVLLVAIMACVLGTPTVADGKLPQGTWAALGRSCLGHVQFNLPPMQNSCFKFCGLCEFVSNALLNHIYFYIKSSMLMFL